MIGEKMRDTGWGVAKLGRFLWHYQAEIGCLIASSVGDDLFAR